MIVEYEKQEMKVNSSTLRDVPFKCVGLDGKTLRPGLTFSGSDLKTSQDLITEIDFLGTVSEDYGDGFYLYHLGDGEIDMGPLFSLRINRSDLYPAVFVASLSLGDVPDFSQVIARPNALGFGKTGWFGF